MRRQLFSILILIVSSTRVAAGCIDPATLAHSTVSIMRHFDNKEREARPGVLGEEPPVLSPKTVEQPRVSGRRPGYSALRGLRRLAWGVKGISRRTHPPALAAADGIRHPDTGWRMRMVPNVASRNAIGGIREKGFPNTDSGFFLIHGRTRIRTNAAGTAPEKIAGAGGASSSMPSRDCMTGCA